MDNKLKLRWLKDPSTSEVFGTFTDVHGDAGQIRRATRGYIVISDGMALTTEMCAELSLVLGYIAYAKGKFPGEK